MAKNQTNMVFTGFLATKFPLETEELKGQLIKAIEKLPPMASKVFQMHYIEQLSYTEIAANLGLSRSTVGKHIERALKELRNELKNKF